MAAELELACWRQMPVMPANVETFATAVQQLQKADPANRWAGVFRMYLASLRRDRAAMLALSDIPAPEKFPYVAAESVQFKRLVEKGMSQPEAGLKILAARSYDPLHGLLDLDRSISQESEFLRESNRVDDAKKLEAARDRLRKAWLACSRHVVERCFALNLLGRDLESKSLAEKSRAIAWLSSPEALREMLNRIDAKQAWEMVIQPLLKSEVAVVEAPPQIDQTSAQARPMAITAKNRTAFEGATLYTGQVQAASGDLQINCDQLAVMTRGTTATLSGSGKVSVRGISGRSGPVTAEAFTFLAQTGEFSFSQHVRLDSNKARLCVIDRCGQITAIRTLLDDLREAKDPGEKLRVAQQVLANYTDQEMSPEARYWVAMVLIRPQLTWHNPYPPAPDVKDKDRVKYAEQAEHSDHDWRWEEAHGGEAWMQEDAQRKLGNPPAGMDKSAARFWRLKDPEHPTIARALALLDAVSDRDKELELRARRWAADLRRNNTVITFDVTGGYGAGKAAPLVMDVRGAEKLSFKVYRVKRAADLVPICGRIGEDFIYRDYGLQQDHRMHRAKMMTEMMRSPRLEKQWAGIARPKLDEADLVAQWEAPVAQLKTAGLSRWDHGDRDWDNDDSDDWYFDDRCERFRDRLEKRYWRDTDSSWQCDRIVEIPADTLKQPGAYVLVGQANGQIAYAPILVDPLSLTMRRCRDGVFVLVSDTSGNNPVGGANVLAHEMLGSCTTDAQGAGFARVFAAGDRAIIAEKDGRFAIGGFGRVFEGIYRSDADYGQHILRQRVMRMQREISSAAQVYSDRFIVAAYTDRPTYRPGQEVNFKLIVRMLKPTGQGGGFRDEDFEPGANLELPPAQGQLRYEVINAKGRVISTGTLRLNDYGTAARKITLSPEEATGTCSLSVWVGGADRIVPDVFAVKYYRRPNFEVKLSGVPAKLEIGKALKVQIAGDYYFGKPVAGAKVDLRIVRPSHWRAIANAAGELSAAGKAEIELALPEGISAGEYFVIAAVTDASGRTVTQSAPTSVIDPSGSAPAARGLGLLPRFAAVNEALTVQADEPVVARQGGDETGRFVPAGGKAEIKLAKTGWHLIKCGTDQTEIFIYGEGASFHEQDATSRLRPQRLKMRRNDDDDDRIGRWVLLDEADDEWNHSPWQRHGELMVLFDRQHVKVGDKLRILVHLPYEKARLLFTIEGRTVIDYYLTTTQAAGPFHVVEIPLRQRHAPNFYLQGRAIAMEGKRFLIHERSLEKMQDKMQELMEEGSDPRWCRVDVLAPPEPPGGQKLKLQVTADRAQYQPGEDVDITVKVTDLSGKPCEAEFSLAGVDQSVYSFGEDALESLPRMLTSTRGAVRYFEKTWRSSIGERSYSQHQIAMAQEMAKAMQQAQKMADKLDKLAAQVETALAPNLHVPGQRPVSSIELVPLRMDFRETATWQPQLRTGADGIARASFKLPDSLTSYRLSAVGLTKDTRIGVGRATLRASKPLALQVFLPRFAVEGDRLLAVAMIHNNTSAEQVCEVLWDISGAKVDGSTKDNLRIAANSSAKAQAWLSMEQPGPVSVSVRAGNAQFSDGEKRDLRIEPLGRARDVALNGAIDKSAKVQLPAGFIASDLSITITRKDPAAAMDGLEYLIDYPYGCVEQTMSRFRPAVAVSHAAGQVNLQIPIQAKAKLPEVLARGLARLYNFQHADGGWGWWEKDATNDNMTLYVLEGLARCRAAGTQVDDTVIVRGCDYVKSRLSKSAYPVDQAARAWLVLALAGQADAQTLADYSAANLKSASGDAKCSLALACRLAGRVDLSRRIWAACRDWKPASTASLALKLEAQMMFLDPLSDAYATSHEILDRRQGQRWESTQATAAAIESMANMLRYSKGTIHARSVSVKIDSNTALNLSDPADLANVSYRLRLSGKALPMREALPLELAIDCDQPVQYAITALGTQRLDKLEETGSQVKVIRSLQTLDGKTLAGTVGVGQVIGVKLTLELSDAREFFMIEDRRPAEFEFADEQITGPQPAHTEFKDDRVSLFFTKLPPGRHEFTYYLRAETLGRSHMLPACAYPMYQEKIRGDSAANVLVVK